METRGEFMPASIEDARELLRIEPEPVEREILVKHGLLASKERAEQAPTSGLVLGGAEEGPGGGGEPELLTKTQALFESQEWGSPSEVSELAVRLGDFDRVDEVLASLKASVGDLKNRRGMSIFQVHPWQRFVPFSKIANMIDLMNLFVKVILIAVVLISIMNVLIMAVYERIREIGTISAIGTPPRKVLGLFVSEGLLLGVLGTIVGTVLSLGVIYYLNYRTIQFAFGRQDNLVLEPTIDAASVITVGLLTIGVSVLASLQPAWKASRMDPITALRHV